MAEPGDLYSSAAERYGPVIRRIAMAYEANPDRRRDLLQEIHIQLWLSLRRFDGRSSLLTWVYRVAHNVAATHVLRERRLAGRLVGLEDLEDAAGAVDGVAEAVKKRAVSTLFERISRLKPLDRQVILLYLEGETAASIAEVTGLSASHVAVKIHRVKRMLNEEETHG